MKGFTNRKERWVVLNVVCIDIEVGEWYCACVERWRFNEHEGTSSKRNPFTRKISGQDRGVEESALKMT